MEDDIPYLPAHLVLEKIVPYLPTKSSIRVSSLSKHCWDQRLFFSKPVLNFDEYDDIESVNQHKKFINFLEGYLKFCLEKGDEEHALDSLKLHLKTFVPRDEISYGPRDANIVIRWMSHAFERKVKVLDICVGTCQYVLDMPILCLNWVDRFAKAKYLTSLSLAQMALKGVRSSPNDRSNDDEPLLPSLKTLSFICVRFYKDVIPSWLCESPSLQYMSLTGCNFEYIQLYIQNCPSLRCLEFKYCGRLNLLSVDKVENLQSFTYISLPEPLSKCRELHLDLNVSSNMKNIYIDCLDGLEALYLRGCHALEATIITKSLKYLTFQGHLTAKVSPKACSQANICLGAEQFWTDQRSLPDHSPYFPSVMKFLRNFEWCEEIFLTDPCDFKALVFPESYRKLLPAPLPKSCILVVMMQNPPTEGSGDYLDLMNSLHWIAPSAWIAILPPVGTKKAATDDKEVRAAGEQLLQVREVIDAEFSRCCGRGESNDRQQEANQQQYGSSSNQGGGFRSTSLSDKDRVLKTVQEAFDGANKLREEARQMTAPGQEMESKDKEKLATIRTVGNVQLIGELLKQKTDEGTEVCRIRNNFTVQLFFRIIFVFISFMRRLFAFHSSSSSSSSEIATTDQEKKKKKKKKNKSARKLARLERELGL